MIKNYMIAEGATHRLVAFEEYINKMIAEGWKPQGGICFTFNDSGNTQRVYQAMIKEEEK